MGGAQGGAWGSGAWPEESRGGVRGEQLAGPKKPLGRDLRRWAGIRAEPIREVELKNGDGAMRTSGRASRWARGVRGLRG